MKEKTIQPNDTTNFEKKKKKRKRDSQEQEQELENNNKTKNVSETNGKQKNEQETKKVKKSEKNKEQQQQQNNVEDQKKKKKKTKKNSKKNKEQTEDNIKNENDVVESEEPEKKKMKKKKSKKQKKEEQEQEKTIEESNNEVDSDSNSSSPSQIHFHSKSLYKESEATKKLTQEQVEAFHSKNNITVSENGKMFKPILSFKDSQFSPDMLVSCKDFTSPTPIQSQSWPIILSGRDLIGIAATGSGKTIAFVLPSLVHIKHESSKNNNSNNNNNKNNSNNYNKFGPMVLVLSPTRELAMQTDQVYSSAGKAANIHSVCVYGGVPKDEQRRAIRSGVQVVVGTPGRIIDLIEEGSLPTGRVTYLVLDEADRMLDLGFKDAIHSIISKTTPTGIRQTLMFSATWPEEIQELAHKYLAQPIKVTIGSQDLAACHSVTQIVEVMESRDKDRKLDELLKKYHSNRKNKVLVFVLYKKEAVRVGNMLQYKGWKCAAIHGDLTQQQRTLAINQFKDGQRPLLIATDVVARGLDIPDVEYVINYTFPLTIEDYVHRIGRTGRAGKEGLAHTLFTSFDKARAGELVNILKEANQSVPAELEKFGPSPNRKKEHALYGHHFKGTETNGGGAPKQSSHILFD